MHDSETVLLEVRDLKTHFFTRDGIVPAVDGVSFTIRRGQTLGLVGESGCGKSVTSLSIMRLVPPPGRIVGGAIRFRGQDLVTLDDASITRIRGRRISMVFQEPMVSLNPVLTIGFQVAEAIRAHESVSPAEARHRAIDMLRLVGIPQPELRYRSYPHELSGGMRQRVMIAMALACEPDLLIADEPTTALDVTIQAQILDLIRELKERLRMAVLLITHDLGVIAEMADEVAVMYAGKIVEQAEVTRLFTNPLHPYTQGLLSSIPTLSTPRERRLNVIHGSVPNLLHLPPGCRYASRCPLVLAQCAVAEPPPIQREKARVACWRYDEPNPSEYRNGLTCPAPGSASAVSTDGVDTSTGEVQSSRQVSPGFR